MRKFKTTLIATMLVSDKGDLQRNGVNTTGWVVTQETAKIDGIVFNPWQEVFVDQMGEFEAVDHFGGRHKFFRSVVGSAGNVRPLARSDVREGRT